MIQKMYEVYLGSALAPGEQDSAQASNYKGNWDASTNTPTLVNGVGKAGDFYICTVAGTCDFGAGAIIFEENDWVVYTGEAWVVNKAVGEIINDNTIDTQLTWSSHKINAEIQGLLDDNFTSTNTTWSSSKIQQAIESGTSADVFVYKGEVDELPETAVLGQVYKLTTTGLAYWWDGTQFEEFKQDLSAYYTKAETDTLPAGKVDKETGTGLSTEDFTTAEKTKLAGIENGAEVNTIESVSVNNVALTPDANKNVDITVPTKTSDITNDSNFVTTSDLATVAETGSYDDLTDKPTLGTASEKDSTTYVNPGNNNIPTSNAVYQAMTSMLEGAFHPAGNKTCAELTSDLLVQANVGHIYKITDNGVTDANWIGGAGQTITANQLAVVVYGNTAGTFLFNLENGINVDMSTYQTKAITPITVDGTVKSNVEDALDAINTLAGSNKTGLGNKADKVSGATNGNFAGLDANGNLTDTGINADSLNDLQLTYDGLNYPTTSALITQLTLDIVARKHSSGTVGGNIAITWTGKSCVTGSYSIHDSGAGFVVLDFENAQDGNKHCVYYISNGSATGITWSKLATTDWVSINNYVKHTGKDLSAAGWYKIAKLTPSNYGSSIIVKLTSNYNYYNNTALTFCLSYANTTADCRVLSYTGNNDLFTSIRLIDDYVEVYYAQNVANAVNAIIMISENNAGQTQIENFVTDSTATGGIVWNPNNVLVVTTENLTNTTLDEYQLQVGSDNYAWFDLGTSTSTSKTQAFLFYEITYGRVDGAQSKILVSCSGTMADGNYFKIVNLNNAQTSAAEQFKVDSNRHLWLGMQSYCYARVKVYGRWAGMGSKTTVEPTGIVLPIQKLATKNDLPTSGVGTGINKQDIVSGEANTTINIPAYHFCSGLMYLQISGIGTALLSYDIDFNRNLSLKVIAGTGILLTGLTLYKGQTQLGAFSANGDYITFTAQYFTTIRTNYASL